MPRLFSGIEIPENIRAELTRLQSGLDGARWISPENFHITLRFAGDIDDRLADEFSQFLTHIEFAHFEITLKNMGSFGGRKPRAVWIGIEPNQILMDLQHAHEMAAQKAGLKPESRKFVPHVTLARLRAIRADATARYLENTGNITLPSFEVTSAALFSSRPGGGGGPYRVETTYPCCFNQSSESSSSI